MAPDPVPSESRGLSVGQWLVMAAIVGAMALGSWLAVRYWLAPQALPELAMTGQDGKPMRFSAFRGKWLIVFFGYTSCPDACPTALSQMADAMKHLGPKARTVQVVMITVDPERDRPQALARYMPYFDSSFRGLSPSPSRLEDVARPFGARWSRENTARGYTFNHTVSFFVVDPQGILKTSFLLPLPPGELERILSPT